MTDGNGRAERLARQLRANLRRRKGQARARSAGTGADEPGPVEATDPGEPSDPPEPPDENDRRDQAER